MKICILGDAVHCFKRESAQPSDALHPRMATPSEPKLSLNVLYYKHLFEANLFSMINTLPFGIVRTTRNCKIKGFRESFCTCFRQNGAPLEWWRGCLASASAVEKPNKPLPKLEEDIIGSLAADNPRHCYERTGEPLREVYHNLSEIECSVLQWHEHTTSSFGSCLRVKVWHTIASLH